MLWGSAMHFLFGVKNMLRKLANNQGRLVHQLNQFTTIVNHTYNKIQANRDQINLLSHKMTDLNHHFQVHRAGATP